MSIHKKFLISLLITFGLVGGMAGLNASSPQVSAKTRYFIRYLNGKYNLFHNVPGRSHSYLMHYGRNYKNQKVYTGGTYWHNHKHYTRVVRNNRFFGFMNIAGGSRRKPRMRYHRRYVRHFSHRYPRQNYASNYIERSNDSDTPSYKYNVELGHTWFRSNDYHQYKLAKKDRSLIQQGLYTYDAKHNTMDPTQKLTAEEYQSSHENSDNSDNEANQNSSNDASNKTVQGKPAYKGAPFTDAQLVQATNARTLQDINNDRAQYGLNPLTVDNELENVAQMRAKQITTNFNHYNSNGEFMGTIDGQKLGYQNFESGENISCDYVNPKIVNPSSQHIHPHNQINKNADDMEDSMMNHDQAEGNGHRENILDSTSTHIGIGSAIGSYAGNKAIYLDEEFI